MIPPGYHYVLNLMSLYQHCAGHDACLLQTRAPGFPFAVWCPVCEHMVIGPDELHTVNDWNDHCIARLSGGRGT